MNVDPCAVSDAGVAGVRYYLFRSFYEHAELRWHGQTGTRTASVIYNTPIPYFAIDRPEAYPAASLYELIDRLEADPAASPAAQPQHA